MTDYQIVQVSRAELKLLIKEQIEESVARGVSASLAELGLTNAEDVREIKNIVDAYRVVKKEVLGTIAKTVTTFVIGALALWFTLKFGWFR